MSFRSPLRSLPSDVADAIFDRGTRLVDRPLAQQLTIAAGSSVAVDVSDAVSIDLSWFWTIGTAKAGSAFKWFGRLRFDWLDSAGRLIWSDAVELINEGAGTVGARSHTGVVRTPATGSTLRIAFEDTNNGQALTTSDSASVQLVSSNRPTDRFRYIGQAGYGTTEPDTGILLNRDLGVVSANSVGPTAWSEAFDGPVDLHLFSVAGGTFRIRLGAQSWGTSAFIVPIVNAAGQSQRLPGLLCPRSHVGVGFDAGPTGGNAYALVVRSSV